MYLQFAHQLDKTERAIKNGESKLATLGTQDTRQKTKTNITKTQQNVLNNNMLKQIQIT